MEKTKHAEELFLEAQRKLGSVKKDGSNSLFKSHYATYPAVVDAVKGPLNELGLSFRHTSRYVDNHFFVGSEIMSKDGRVAHFEMPMLTDTPQKMGSALTYYKRYTLEAVLGLPTEDDDGNATSTHASPKRAPAQTQSSAPSRVSAPQKTQGAPEKKAPGPSEPQLKRLFAISKQSGVEKFDVDSYMKTKWGLDSRTYLSRPQYDELCNLLSSGMFYQQWEDHLKPDDDFSPPKPIDDAPPYRDSDIPF